VQIPNRAGCRCLDGICDANQACGFASDTDKYDSLAFVMQRIGLLY